MISPEYFTSRLFAVHAETFDDFALKLFRFQATYNLVYRKYLHYLKVSPAEVNAITAIPFLPIHFFKNHPILTPDGIKAEIYFESSGTTGQQRSRHYVADRALYHRVAETIFVQMYGKLSDYHIFALLPSYLERQHASLVAMASHFIRQSRSTYSGFYLNNTAELINKIKKAGNSRKVLLIGVSFALLDLAEQHQPDLHDVIVMETGGMKGRRKEMTRDELHTILRKNFNVTEIHSEYGMTELLSQAYARQAGKFRVPTWMKILIRDINDPFCLDQPPGVSGGINVIDLANIYSCAFIETQDLGRLLKEDHTFEVLGRFDQSEIRGCSLMVL